MRLRTWMAGLVATLALAAIPVAAEASSWAGIRISVGKFSLHVYYSVAIDYPEQSRAIRDPGAALFSLLAVIQANAERFAAIDHDFMVELSRWADSGAVFLDVCEDPFVRPESPSETYVALDDVPVRDDVAAQIVAALCGRYPAACARPPLSQVTLYACPKAPCPGQIAFGSFPSDDLDERFALLPPRGRRSKAITVTRERIRQQLETLEE